MSDYAEFTFHTKDGTSDLEQSPTVFKNNCKHMMRKPRKWHVRLELTIEKDNVVTEKQIVIDSIKKELLSAIIDDIELTLNKHVPLGWRVNKGYIRCTIRLK